MANQPVQLLALLVLAVCSLHSTCVGFGLPPIITPPTVPPATSTSQEPVSTDPEGSTEQPQATTETIPTTDNGSEASAYQVHLIMDVAIPPIASRVKLGQFSASRPGQFATGPGLDLTQGIFKAPYQGIYYFSASVHIKAFPTDTTELVGSLAVGVCVDNRCTEGSIQDATLSAKAPFQAEGFSLQASGLLQLEKCQTVKILLEHDCTTDFVISSLSSLSIIKLM